MVLLWPILMPCSVVCKCRHIHLTSLCEFAAVDVYHVRNCLLTNTVFFIILNCVMSGMCKDI